MDEVSMSVNGKEVVIEVVAPTFREIMRMRKKYLKIKPKLVGGNIVDGDVEFDYSGMVIELMTKVVKVVKIKDNDEWKIIEIEKEEDWDKVDTDVADEIMGVVIERFFR